MIVYEIFAWFGDCEWSEGIFASEESAQAALDLLFDGCAWTGMPDWVRGGYESLVKAYIEPREVKS